MCLYWYNSHEDFCCFDARSLRKFLKSSRDSLRCSFFPTIFLNMALFTFFLFFELFFIIDASPVLQKTAISGSSLSFSCESSFAPVWAKVDTKQGQYKTLAISGKKHPNFHDSRFEFSELDSGFKLEIKNVGASDAGTYVCDGSKSYSYLLTVVR